MDSIFKLEMKVKSFLNQLQPGNNKTLWDKLVQSSIKLNGDGCTGLLIGEIQSLTEKILTNVSDEKLHQIWEETENGIHSIAAGFSKAHRMEMIHDISIEIVDIIAEDICEEAQKILKARKRKNKSKKN